ncbi:MAG: zinc-binding alcohol dehydrogenase family protein [Cyanobacteria bacterium J06635_10]
MRNIAICGSQLKPSILNNEVIDTIDLEGIKVNCGLINTRDPNFDSNAPKNKFMVLVKIRAFSCNYRDKNLILKTATTAPDTSFYVIGSEFVGEVIDIGAEVTELKIGDSVIGDGCYPYSRVEGVIGGLPTNNGSKEYQIFHYSKLIKIPSQMPKEVAAAFPIGGQTSYSMIRKLNITPGENILVTAAKSNTSLFAINALQKYDVNVYAVSTSMQFKEQLEQMGVKKLIQIDPNQESLLYNEEIVEIVRETGGFNCVIDPLFDIYLGKVIHTIATEGRYVTCGFYDQYSHLTNQNFEYRGCNMQQIIEWVMTQNIQIIGNCIGYTTDLQQAIQEYTDGSLNVMIDSVFKEKEIGAFFDRTYNAKDRFGKVIYQYN